MKDASLINEFVASFGKFDELLAMEEVEPDVLGLTYGDYSENGYRKWRPMKVMTDQVHLQALYEKLPTRFPPLYEKLLLNYRWARVELNDWALSSNPVGDGLDNLFLMRQIIHDPAFTEIMFSKGFMQFGMASSVDYDPVCFDFSGRRKGGDCPIVQLDHEEIIIKRRIVKVKEMAESFRALVLRTIRKAEEMNGS